MAFGSIFGFCVNSWPLGLYLVDFWRLVRFLDSGTIFGFLDVFCHLGLIFWLLGQYLASESILGYWVDFSLISGLWVDFFLLGRFFAFLDDFWLFGQFLSFGLIFGFSVNIWLLCQFLAIR